MSTDQGGGGPLSWIPTVVAVVALALFAYLIYHMYNLTGAGTPDPQWNRAVYLLTGVEAIAFAAAGFLFGREVNRKRAEKAEERADKSDKEASAAKTTAADVTSRAKSLKELVTLKVNGQPAKAARYGPLGPDAAAAATQTTTQADLEEVAQLAARLFP